MSRADEGGCLGDLSQGDRGAEAKGNGSGGTLQRIGFAWLLAQLIVLIPNGLGMGAGSLLSRARVASADILNQVGVLPFQYPWIGPALVETGAMQVAQSVPDRQPRVVEQRYSGQVDDGAMQGEVSFPKGG